VRTDSDGPAQYLLERKAERREERVAEKNDIGFAFLREERERSEQCPEQEQRKKDLRMPPFDHGCFCAEGEAADEFIVHPLHPTDGRGVFPRDAQDFHNSSVASFIRRSTRIVIEGQDILRGPGPEWRITQGSDLSDPLQSLIN